MHGVRNENQGGEIKSAPSLCSLSDSPLATIACRDSLTCLKCSRTLSHKSVQIHVNLCQDSFTRTSSKPEPVRQSRSPAPERGRYDRYEAATTLVIPSSVASAEQHGSAGCWTLTSDTRAGSSVCESKEELSERISVLPTRHDHIGAYLFISPVSVMHCGSDNSI